MGVVLAAGLAMAAAASAASGPSGKALGVTGCVVLTDPANDVDVVGQRVYALGGTQVDVLRVDLAPMPGGVRVVVGVADLDARLPGFWSVGLTVGRSRVVVQATQGLLSGTAAGRPMYRAGVAGKPLAEVTGRVDTAATQVVVDVPYRAVGGAFRAGAVAHSFDVEAEMTLSSSQSAWHEATVSLHDAGASTRSARLGAECLPTVVAVAPPSGDRPGGDGPAARPAQPVDREPVRASGWDVRRPRRHGWSTPRSLDCRG